MPKQKDLKRVVRTRMQKTGESYTAARAQVIKKNEPAPDLAALAGMSDESVQKQTGRTWTQWVRVLDAAQAAEKPHREIARYVSSLGTPDWWSQMVTVGYERIRGLRERRQRRDGRYEANKSRTFHVPLAQLYEAFADDDRRAEWLDVETTVKSATRHKRMRLTWHDGTSAILGFTGKSDTKSMVAVQHEKLPDRATADAMKVAWSAYFDRLAALLRN
jgi:uncharacterized protein YndB with AHSA1/START domain